MTEDLVHARRLLDMLEEWKLKIPRQMYEEFTRLVELTSETVSAEDGEVFVKLSELEEFLR